MTAARRVASRIWVGILLVATVPCVLLALLYVVSASYVHWVEGHRWPGFGSSENASILLIAAAFVGGIVLLLAVSLNWAVSWRKRADVSSKLVAAWALLLLLTPISLLLAPHQYLVASVFLLGTGKNSEYLQVTAAQKDSTALLNALLFRNAKLFDDLLVVAARSDSTSVIRFLIERGVEPNKLRRANRAALHYAVEEKRYRSAEALVKAGARADIPDGSGITPLDVAERRNDQRMLDILKTR